MTHYRIKYIEDNYVDWKSYIQNIEEDFNTNFDSHSSSVKAGFYSIILRDKNNRRFSLSLKKHLRKSTDFFEKGHL